MEARERSLLCGGALFLIALACFALAPHSAQQRHAQGSRGRLSGLPVFQFLPELGIGSELGRHAEASQPGADAPRGLGGNRRLAQADPAPGALNVTVGGYTGITWRGWGTSLAW